METNWCVYILQCNDDSLYTGATLNLKIRLANHQAGKAAKYTRSHLPVKLVYVEPSLSKTAALQRELAIKKLNHSQKLELIKFNQNKILIASLGL